MDWGLFLLQDFVHINGLRIFCGEKSGEEAVERFHGLTKQLTNLFNAFLIVGSVFAALGRNPITGRGSGAKKKMLEKSSKIKVTKKTYKGNK